MHGWYMHLLHLDERLPRKPQRNVDHTRCSDDVGQASESSHIEDICRVVAVKMVSITLFVMPNAAQEHSHEALRDNVQAQQVDHCLITGRHGLRQRSSDGKPREHLHQVVMRGVQSLWQARQILDLCSGVVVVSALFVAHGRSSCTACS